MPIVDPTTRMCGSLFILLYKFCKCTRDPSDEVLFYALRTQWWTRRSLCPSRADHGNDRVTQQVLWQKMARRFSLVLMFTQGFLKVVGSELRSKEWVRVISERGGGTCCFRRNNAKQRQGRIKLCEKVDNLQRLLLLD